LFDSVTLHVYKHWEENRGEDHADMEFEAQKLAERAGQLQGEYVIVAKSVGVPITIRAVVENGAKPTKCIFLGGAVKGADDNLLAQIAKFDIPTLFIQQTNDPIVFTHEEMEKFLEENWKGDYKLIEAAGDNHAYDNYEEIKGWVKDFIS